MRLWPNAPYFPNRIGGHTCPVRAVDTATTGSRLCVSKLHPWKSLSEVGAECTPPMHRGSGVDSRKLISGLVDANHSVRRHGKCDRKVEIGIQAPQNPLSQSAPHCKQTIRSCGCPAHVRDDGRSFAHWSRGSLDIECRSRSRPAGRPVATLSRVDHPFIAEGQWCVAPR